MLLIIYIYILSYLRVEKKNVRKCCKCCVHLTNGFISFQQLPHFRRSSLPSGFRTNAIRSCFRTPDAASPNKCKLQGQHEPDSCIHHHSSGHYLTYCSWFRNAANHLGCIKPCKYMGKTTKLNWCRISNSMPTGVPKQQ